MRNPFATRPTRGFTLVELLVSIIMLSIIMAAALSLFSSQSVAFRRNADRYDLLQNARAALEGSERIIRTIGAGTTSDQPVLVYGANDVLAFNTDYAETDSVDIRWATNFNPDMSTAETQAWDVNAAGAIPNSSYVYPSVTYRMGNGSIAVAETYIFYLQPDASTSRSDDYILWQRINAGTPELVARNILPHPNGKPFFEYLMRRQTTGNDTMITVATADLPLKRQLLAVGITTADSASYTRPDSVRAVRMSMRLSNGLTGTAERVRDVTTTIGLPNNGIVLPSVCGRSPLAPVSLNVSNLGSSGSGRVSLTWTASADQATGEQDVLQYIVYRRLSTSTSWTDPLLVIRSQTGTTTYTVETADNLPNTSYSYGIAAQDCTPSISSILRADITTTPIVP